MKKSIYSLKMFEATYHFDNDVSPSTSPGVKIRRVPGGWTFTEWESSFEDAATQTRISSVFVPYSDESHPMHEPKKIS